MRSFIIISGGVVLLFVGCSMLPEAAREISQPPLSAAEAITLINERSAHLKTMSGSGTLTVESPEMNATISFELFLRCPDSLLILLRGPFGVEVGSLFIAGQTFSFYNPSTNEVIEGNADQVQLPWLADLEPSGANLNAILTATTPLPETETITTSSGIGDSSPHSTGESDTGKTQETTPGDKTEFSYRQPSGIIRVTIDRKLGVIERYAKFDKYHHAKLVGEYHQYFDANGVLMPHLVKITLPQERKRISLYFNKAIVNKNHVSLTWTYPQNAERRIWK